MQIEQEEVTLPLFADNRIIYIENPKESIKITAKINE